jgi:multiple sugar transport system substrate-binding protein
LGTGTDPEQEETQKKVVEDFNKSQDKIELVLEVVPYDSERDTLSTQIASGQGPDIVGPVGWSGSNAFYGQWLDMAPYIKETNFDTSVFDPALVKFYQTEEGQVGLPFAVFPAAVFYQTEAFDEAGLNYPPTAYGEKYVWPDGTEEEWSWETLAKVAKKLTVDANGVAADEEGFDRDKAVQYGYAPQWQHPNHMGAFFGAGLPDEDGKVPEAWKDAWNFIYDGMWGEEPFIPTGPVSGSAEFGTDNNFNSGKVAMAVTHMWYTCCLGDAGQEWDLAVLPTYKGKVNGLVDADTFRIWKGTKHPKEAFEVVSYLYTTAVPALAPTYGAMPALTTEVDGFFAAKSEEYPFVKNWDAIEAGLVYPDVPSAEGYMPNWNEAWNRIDTFGNLMKNEGKLDVDAEIVKLEADLKVIFGK